MSCRVVASLVAEASFLYIILDGRDKSYVSCEFDDFDINSFNMFPVIHIINKQYQPKES